MCVQMSLNTLRFSKCNFCRSILLTAFILASTLIQSQLVKKTCNIIAHGAIGCPGGKVDRFLPLHEIQSFLLLRDASLAPAVMDLAGGISPISVHAAVSGEQSSLQLHDSPDPGDSTRVLFLSRQRDFAILRASSCCGNEHQGANDDAAFAASGHGHLVFTCLRSRRVLARLSCTAHHQSAAAAPPISAAPAAHRVGAAEIIPPHVAFISPINMEHAPMQQSSLATLIASPIVGRLSNHTDSMDAVNAEGNDGIASALPMRRVACDALARLSCITFDEVRCELATGHADGRVRFWSH